MLYRATTSSIPAQTKLLRVAFSADEWRRIARSEKAFDRRMNAACLMLALAGFAIALWGGVHGLWKGVLFAAGVLFLIGGLPIKSANGLSGLDAEGNVVDRAALDRYVLKKLKAYCSMTMKGVTVKPLTEDAEPEAEAEIVPLTAFLGEEAPKGAGWPVLIAMAVVAGIYFLIWRGNVGGGFANFLSIAACVLAALCALLFATAKTARGRLVVLTALVFLAMIGATRFYTHMVLVPQALEAVFSEHTGDSAEARRGLMVVRCDNQGNKKVLFMPLGDPERFEVYALAGSDRLLDSAAYGVSGRVKGYAYGCTVDICDNETGRLLDSVTLETKLPDKATAHAGDVVVRPSDAQVVRAVRQWMKESGRR